MDTIGNKITLNSVTINKAGRELTMEREDIVWNVYIDGNFVKRISNDDALGISVKAVFEGTITAMN